MRFRLGCELDYEVEEGEASFLFHVEPQERDGQAVLEQHLAFTPPLEAERFVEPDTGNRLLRVRAGPGPLKLRHEALVQAAPAVLDPGAVREVPADHLPMALLPHLLPSRYVESDRLAGFAEKTFGALPPGHARVTALCDWVRDHLDYVRGSSDEETTACDTLVQREGVCRDYAHLAIGLCRGLGIPARFVSAYAWQLDPPDFHAVMEAWLEGPQGGAWFLFDPTRMAPPDGLVRIGVAADAAGVAFCTPRGKVSCGKPRVWIDAVEAGAAGAPAEAAVSLS
ncbi:transglutaminase family protein [Roseococcus sp. DSY-14]|uniref:transglutaminase-like domain-containing protein n=1 Tax=Roseococcus sp. DSY-14 TaxID=3369650 RepID=UPI00387A937B